MNKPSREELQKLCLVDRLTESEIADKYEVHRNTISRWKREYEINIKDWWKYQELRCRDCDIEIDPDVELESSKRMALIRARDRGKLLCQDCDEKVKREYNRHKQAEWRENNRDKYNEYMKRWRKENKDKWLEIKRRSARKNKNN